MKFTIKTILFASLFLAFVSPFSLVYAFDSRGPNIFGLSLGESEHEKITEEALKDLGFVKFDEPFSKLFNQGIVYKDGHKMSKSFGNVIFQTDISNKYGIDTARLFLMFVASPDKQMEWNDEGVEGTFRIINKMIRLAEKVDNNSNPIQDHKINLAIKNVTASIENFEYPKAIISIVECVDAFADGISKENYKILLKLLHPFCPHITEELWEKLREKNFISLESWPKADEKKINDKFEQEEKAVENLGGDINNVLKIMKEKSNKKSLKVYIYVLPNELSLYKNSSDLIKKKTGLDVEIFAVNDKNKYDPENKSGKAKPGKPAIYLN